VNNIEKLFAELKKMVEQQKIAEEQERLRRLQVIVDLICRNKSAIITAKVAASTIVYMSSDRNG